MAKERLPTLKTSSLKEAGQGLKQESMYRSTRKPEVALFSLDSQGLLDSSLMASGTASRSEDEESLAGQKRASSQALGTIPKRRSSSRYSGLRVPGKGKACGGGRCEAHLS